LSRAPVSVGELAPSGSTEETSLRKCTVSTEDAGPSDKIPLPPIAKVEEIPQCPGKEHVGIVQESEKVKTVEEEGQYAEDISIDPSRQAGRDSEDSHIFSGLSDIMVTASELFKDNTSQLSLPGADTSQAEE